MNEQSHLWQCADSCITLLPKHGRVWQVQLNDQDAFWQNPNWAGDWHRVIPTDLEAVFFLTQDVCRQMLKQSPARGSVVNMGSVHTLAVLPGSGPYDAAKCGVVGMSKNLAVELASRGIRVNVVSPGLCNTQIWEDIKAAAPTEQACTDHWKNQIPLGRTIEPQEVGELTAFLLSDRAASITGANLLIDGGMISQLISREPYEPKAIDG